MKSKKKCFNSKSLLTKSKILGKMQYVDFLSVITRQKNASDADCCMCAVLQWKITSMCLSLTPLKPTHDFCYIQNWLCRISMFPLIHLCAKVGTHLDILFHLSSNISFTHVEPKAGTDLFCFTQQ